jgi:hypothetical protein
LLEVIPVRENAFECANVHTEDAIKYIVFRLAQELKAELLIFMQAGKLTVVNFEQLAKAPLPIL